MFMSTAASFLLKKSGMKKGKKTQTGYLDEVIAAKKRAVQCIPYNWEISSRYCGISKSEQTLIYD